MKKIFTVWMIVVLLVLAGCQPDAPTADPSQSTQKTPPASTSTEPTQKTTPESTSSEPTDSTLVHSLSPQSYEWSPEHLHPFPYIEGEKPYVGGAELDVSDLHPGHLYVYDETTESVTHIADEVIRYDVSQEHLFYALKAEPMKIYRAGYQGEGKELIVDLAERSELSGAKEIIFDFYGLNAMGKFLLRVDRQKLFVYDMSDQSLTFLMEHEFIEYSYYLYPERIVWAPTNERMEYMYFIETGENRPFYS